MCMVQRFLVLVVLAPSSLAQEQRNTAIDDSEVVRDVAFWWEHNGDAWLPPVTLPAATHAAAAAIAAPALVESLQSSTDRDLVCSCMMALAKIGPGTGSVDLTALFRARLASADQ